MTRAGGLNLLALCGALATSVAVVSAAHTGEPAGARPSASRDGQAPSQVIDARGVRVPIADYRRIISASIVADGILWRLCDPRRVAAYTTHATRHPLYSHRYAGKPGLEGLGEIERVLSLSPDLVIMSHFADPRHIARIEDQGIAVFDLGEMQGQDGLLGDIRDIATLLGRPEAGQRLATSFERRLARVAADVPAQHRPRAIYLSVYGTKLYGGTRGTSYHDVLTAAGLQDVAADAREGWPELDAETVLSLNPEILVTRRGMRAAICGYPGMGALAACQRPGHVVAVTDFLIDDPGMPMLEAAEEVYQAVYGPGGPGRGPTP